MEKCQRSMAYETQIYALPEPKQPQQERQRSVAYEK